MLLLCLLSLGLCCRAQETTPFWGRQEACLADQTERTLRLVDTLLEAAPPAAGEPSLLRRAALQLLDGVFHDTRLDGSPAVARFMARRMEAVCRALERPMEGELEIWKLYNDGFIVRSAGATVAFDLYRGGPVREAQALITDSMMRALVARCDILFLSHDHPDHVDPAVVAMFAEAGKLVVAPACILPGDGRITRIRPESAEEPAETRIEVRTSAADAGLRVCVLPGHQSELDNNIYAVTLPCGRTVVHTGDQYHRGDLAWLASVGGRLPQVDVLIVNCWANDLAVVVAGFAPRAVLTGHENELGHTIDHRESYAASLDKLRRVGRPAAVMAWGECFRCR